MSAMSGSIVDGGVSSEGKAATNWLSFMLRIVHHISNQALDNLPCYYPNIVIDSNATSAKPNTCLLLERRCSPAQPTAPSFFCDLELPRESRRVTGRELGPRKQCLFTIRRMK